MPKTIKKKTVVDPNTPKLLVLNELGSSGRPKIIPQPAAYADVIKLVRKHFKICPGYDVTLQINELEICGGEMMEITDDVWESVKDSVKRVYFVEMPGARSSNGETTSRAEAARSTSTLAKTHTAVKYPSPQASPSSSRTKVPEIGSSCTMKIIVQVVSKTSPKKYDLRVGPSTTCGAIYRAIAKYYDPTVNSDNHRLLVDGNRVVESDTLQRLNVPDGDTFLLFAAQCGGKPVIYLFSPREIVAKVRLGLTRQWEFSAIYPVVPVKQAVGENVHQVIEWNTQTRGDGSVVETTTGLEVAYLFWEAHTCPGLSPSPPATPTDAASKTDSFVPTNAQLTPGNSVLVSIEDIPGYLDRALKALSLHTEARTSFITYWLPSLLKHKFIALRFLPQSAYEEAAPLEVTPTPDVVTRVFMLFRGVSNDQLEGWQKAMDRASEDVLFWKKTVGVDVLKAMDGKLFRVLEWGGMEVL